MSESHNKPSLPGYDEAAARVVRYAPLLGVERVGLEHARGRVLRQDVTADRDQPPFDRSAMDGFAVRSAEVKGGASWPIIGGVAAGAEPVNFQETMASGSVKRIATGAPVPAGADAVVPIEQATVEGGRVRFSATEAKPWQNVHRRAADAAAGQVVLRAGTRLDAQHIGIAAAVGAVELTVSQRPRVTLLTTGDEVRPPGTPTNELQPQQIRSSNGPLLAAFFEALGVPLHAQVHVADEPEETLAAAREALSHSNLVITVGGVSVGERDFLPGAWRQLGLPVLLHGVAIQPGKPILVTGEPGEEVGSRKSEVGIEDRADKNALHSEFRTPNSEIQSPPFAKMVLGLPGNPVSVLCTAHLFVWAVVRGMMGESDAKPQAAPGSGGNLPWRLVTLAEATKGSSKREVFRVARLNGDGSATVIGWHGSGDLVHTAGADGWVRLPRSDDTVVAGEVVPFLPMVR